MFLRSTLLGCCLALGFSAAQADDAPLKRIQTARALFDFGIEQQDPLLILAAAQLHKTVGVDPTTRAPQDGMTVDGAPFGWSDMLDAAAPLMAGDPTLQGLAKDIRAARSKGVTIGPVYSIVEIRAKGQDVYADVPFDGGQYAEIYVEGAAGIDLNLLVHDSKNRLVCSDTDISAIAYCGWRPASDAKFSITVVNDGSSGGRYSMMTN